jgi:RsiW-degrading membrane proteinase PrsW (M82 family)
MWLTYLASLLGGIVVIVPAALVELLILAGISDMSALAIMAGFVEEPMKQIGVARMAFKTPSWISSRRAGLIAGALAGLGFGVVESIFYTAILSGTMPFSGAIGLRTITILLHMTLSAIVGMGIFYAAAKKSVLKFLLLLLGATTIHAAWNYAALKLS